MLRLTDAAAEHALDLARKLGCEPALRIRVVGGGCAGLTWDIVFGDVGTREGDIPRATEGVRVVVDGRSALRLRGAFVDVGDASRTGLRRATDDGPAEFVVKGLPTQRVCGCGESFEDEIGRRV